MARNFNGTSDVITCTMSTAVANWVFGSMVAVVKRANNTNWNGPLCRVQSGGSAESFLDIAPTGHASNNALWYDYAASSSAGTNTPKVLAADGWVLVAATKPTGTSTVRLHYYVFNTGVWTRVNATSQADSIGASGGSIALGNVVGDFFAGDMDVLAFFPTALSDGQMDTLPTSLAVWDILTPSGMWVLNQASTATSVPDRTGNGANQSSISGTSIASTNSPLTNLTSAGMVRPIIWPGAGPRRASRFDPNKLSTPATASEAHAGASADAAVGADQPVGIKAARGSTQSAAYTGDTLAGIHRANASAASSAVSKDVLTGTRSATGATSAAAVAKDVLAGARTAAGATSAATVTRDVIVDVKGGKGISTQAAVLRDVGVGSKTGVAAGQDRAVTADRELGTKGAVAVSQSVAVGVDVATSATGIAHPAASGVVGLDRELGLKAAAGATSSTAATTDRPLGVKIAVNVSRTFSVTRDALAGRKLTTGSSSTIATGQCVPIARRGAAGASRSYGVGSVCPAGSSKFRDITVRGIRLGQRVTVRVMGRVTVRFGVGRRIQVKGKAE